MNAPRILGYFSLKRFFTIIAVEVILSDCTQREATARACINLHDFTAPMARYRGAPE
jgi:hypothetical protein